IWFVNIQNNPDIKNIEGIQYLSKYIDRITLHNNMALQNIDALAKANDWPYLHTVSIVYTVDRTNPQNKHKINLDGLSSIKFGPNRDPMYAQQGQVLMVKGVDALITPANYSTLSTTSAFLPNYTASLQLLDVHFMDEAGNVVAPSNLTNYLSHFKDANNVNVGSEINIMHNSSPYQLSNVDFLKNNTNLLSFNGGHNMNLKDISGLADAINLKYLNIRNTCVNTPLSVLNNLTNLETASLFATNINSARGLNAANFPKLKQIYLGSTFVGNEDLPLILASLSISDLLEELSLDETLISDVYAFSNYTNSWPLMKAICLEGNSITDFSPLKTFEDRDITIVKGAQVLLFTNKDLYCGKTDAEDPSKTIKKAIYPLIFNPDNTLGISTLPGYYNQALTYTGNGFEGILRRVTFEDIGVVKPNLQFLLQNNNIVIYNKNIDVSKKVKELLQLQADYFAASNHAQKNEISKNFYTILHSISGFENYSYNSAKPLLQFYYVEKGRETDYRNEKYIANSGYILIDAEIIQKPITTTNTSRVTIVAEKTLDGATPNDNSFNFNLKDTTGKVIQTKGNIGRTITFDALSFDKPGEYIYYLSEQLGQAQNINYDPVNYKATITVSLSDNYSVKIGYEKDGQSYKGVPVFTNTTKKVANFPQTGDASMLALWIIIVSISIIAIVSIIYNQKNSNKI
ncbi:MAG: hypothetical protein GYA87_02625, partial [Christensenellaceae bacterium]|nr:hypothetical protein [Christensenellaceae bacterium]